MNLRRMGWGLAAAILVAGCASESTLVTTPTPTTEPTTMPWVALQPSTPAPATQPAAGVELLQPTAEMPGYGVESYRIVNNKDEIVAVLLNGATVICKRVPSPVAAVRGYAMTGGVYEGPWLGGGLSHLLEHLVAGGSCERRTEEKNKELLQAIGNDSNAYTDFDQTCFFVNTTTAHFEEAADIVTGWMLGAKITPAEYRREYQVVQRELERNKGNPEMVFWQMMQANRYKVSPRRVPVIGYQEVIQGLSRDDVYSYYKLAYQPNNLVFSVAADIDPEVMMKVMRNFLKDAKPGRDFSHNIAAEPPVVAPRTMVGTFPQLGEAMVDLAFPSVRESDPDMYALDLLAQILGGGESSILVQDVRDSKQLCMDVQAGDETPSYVQGSLEIDLTLDPANVAAAKAAVLEDLETIKRDGVDAGRLARAKTQMRIARLEGMQTTQDIAASLAEDYFQTGDPHFSDRYVDRIAAVTADQVKAAAIKYLDSGKLVTTVLLPEDAVGAAGLPKAEDLLRAPPSGEAVADIPAESDAKVTRTVLPNGLVVLHKKITTTPLVQMDMFALGGLTAEDASTNGTGNLAMMMLSRGTTTRSADDISEFFDGTGGVMASACGNNTWHWDATCTRDAFEKTMEVYGDVVNHPTFKGDELDKLRKRVLADIGQEDSTWDGEAMRYFKQQYFGPMNSPYQFLAEGSAENVNKLTSGDLKKWYDGKVLASPRVLAIFGDIDKDQALAMAEKYFGTLKLPSVADNALKLQVERSLKMRVEPSSLGMPKYEPTTMPSPSIPVSLVVDAVKIKKTEQPEAGVFIGFKADSVIGEPDEDVLTVDGCLAGGYGYPTGYIFETLRGLGLVYEAASYDSPGQNTNLPGAFIAYAGCDPKNVTQVTDIILQNIARLQGTDKDMQTNWFERSKQLIPTSEALDNEKPQDQASLAATDELFGLGYDYEDSFASRIGAVTLPEVRNVAAHRLSHCIVTICTPDPNAVNEPVGPRSYDSFPPVDLTPRGVQHAQPK